MRARDYLLVGVVFLAIMTIVTVLGQLIGPWLR